MSAKNHIQQALFDFETESEIRTGFKNLLTVMGYSSDRSLNLGSVKEYLSHELVETKLTDKQKQKLFELLRSIDIVFQFNESDIRKQYDLFENHMFDSGRVKSFLFLAVELNKNENYSFYKIV